MHCFIFCVFACACFCAHVFEMCCRPCVCVSVLYLTWLSDSGSQWSCSRSMRLSPGGRSACHAMSPCARLCPCPSVSMRVWGHTCILTRVCICLCLWLQVQPCRSAARQTFLTMFPWGAISLPVGLRVPCATMITFTSTIKSRRAQITVTRRETHPPSPDPVKYDARICSAQHSLS